MENNIIGKRLYHSGVEFEVKQLITNTNQCLIVSVGSDEFECSMDITTAIERIKEYKKKEPCKAINLSDDERLELKYIKRLGYRYIVMNKYKECYALHSDFDYDKKKQEPTSAHPFFLKLGEYDFLMINEITPIKDIF